MRLAGAADSQQHLCRNIALRSCAHVRDEDVSVGGVASSGSTEEVSRFSQCQSNLTGNRGSTKSSGLLSVLNVRF